VLVHWKPAEAEQGAQLLREAGWEVGVISPEDGRAVRLLGNDPPQAFIIDLSRLPSQGLAVAIELRRTAATRRAPLVFVANDPARAERAARVVPDAAFLTWAELPASLEGAVLSAPAEPLVPGTMAGYSGTPLAKKLGIKPGSVVALVGAPEGFEAELDLAGAPTVHMAPGSHRKGLAAQRVLVFARSLDELMESFVAATAAVAAGGGLWLLWPKKSSGMRTDLTEGAVRATGLGAGWVDYKICALDRTWSGLLFAKRKGARA
jgi:hypothetical protein